MILSGFGLLHDRQNEVRQLFCTFLVNAPDLAIITKNSGVFAERLR